MKQIFLIALMGVALVACGERPAAPAKNSDASTSSSSAPAEASKTNAEKVPGKLDEPLPEGIRLDFPYYVRADVQAETKSGVLRRRIGLEFLEGDKDSVLDSLGKSMVEAGFEADEPESLANGNILVSYTKKSYGRVKAAIVPSPGENPFSPAAVGRVTLNFPAPPAKNQ